MIIKKEIEVGKEVGDIMNLFVKIAKTIKEKGDYTSLIGDLVTAVDGAVDIDDELKANKKAVAVAVILGAADLVEVFLPEAE